MHLVFFFYLTIICFFLSLVFLYFRRYKPEMYCSMAGFTFCALTLGSLFALKKNLPIYANFESLVFVTCILGGFVTWCSPPRDYGTSARSWGYIFILLLLSFCLFYPKAPSPDEYNQHYIWISLFYGFRRVALAAMLFSSCCYIQYRRDSHRGIAGTSAGHQGRNYLLLSAICFLISEYAGMIWCQNGWGDFWHWSNAFFQSTLVLLYLMTAFHIPGRNRNSDRARSLIGSLSGVFFLTMMIIRGMI